VDGSGYLVADEELAGLKTMVLTPFAHEEQVNIGVLSDIRIGATSEVDLTAGCDTEWFKV